MAARWRALCALLLLVLPLDAAAAPRAETGGDAIVGWNGKTYALDALPDELDPRAAATIAAWGEWVTLHGYRIELQPEQRLIFISSRKNTRLRKQMALIERTQDLFEELLPSVTSTPRGEDAAGDPATDGATRREGPPETDPDADPEGETAGFDFHPQERGPDEPTTWTYSWGAGSFEPESTCGVLFVLRDEADYAALLDFVAEQESYLREWSGEARKYFGFVLESPLVGGYVEKAAGLEEWSPDHELVHRTMRLLTLWRFGQQPWWLQTGLAWYAEIEIQRSVYCFPYRSEFVYETEHGAWRGEVRSAAKDGVAFDDFAGWTRGAWDARAARFSWAFAKWMAKRRPEQAAPLLESLRVYREAHDRRDLGGGNWERIPGYEIPVAEQRAEFERFLGADFMVEAVKYFTTQL